MAADDINAKGGVLGQKIEVTDYDTQTNPSVSRSAVQKALDDGPYAVVGPIYSGSVKVNMQITQAAKIAQFTGAAAADITQMNNPYIFRMAFSQTNSMPRVARYIAEDLKAKTVAVVWVNDDMGKGGHETIAPELEKRGLKVVADLPVEANQASFTPDVVKIRGAKPDAIFVYMHEEENTRFLKEIRKQGGKAPLVGETTLMNAQTVQLAGDAANGVVGNVMLSPDADVPAVKDFAKRFTERFKTAPDHNAMQGYMAVWLVKAATEKMGKPDAARLADTLHGITVSTNDQPGILLDTTVLANGDVDRQSFMVEVVDGKAVVKSTLPKLGN